MSAFKAKRIQPRARCIYCGADRNITHEHFWPQWLDSICEPRTQADTNTQMIARVRLRAYADPLISFRHRTRQGHARTKTVRQVCHSCNTGWMRDIQNASKPVLAPLILGEGVSVDAAAQTQIAKWAVMTIMTAEHTDRELIAIPAEQRAAFRQSRMPPLGWYLWVGRYSGADWNTRLRHHVFSSLPKAGGAVERPKSYNGQATTLAVGNLLIYAISSVIPDFINRPEKFTQTLADEFGVARIAPFASDAFDWHSLPVLSDTAVAELDSWHLAMTATNADLARLR